MTPVLLGGSAVFLPLSDLCFCLTYRTCRDKDVYCENSAALKHVSLRWRRRALTHCTGLCGHLCTGFNTCTDLRHWISTSLRQLSCATHTCTPGQEDWGGISVRLESQLPFCVQVPAITEISSFLASQQRLVSSRTSQYTLREDEWRKNSRENQREMCV